MTAFRNILVIVDTAEPTPSLLECAEHLVKSSGSRLTLLDVVPEFSLPQRLVMSNYQEIGKVLLRDKRKRIKALAAPLLKAGLDVRTQVVQGRTSVEAIKLSIRDQHDLVMKVVKGPKSRRPGRLGTTALELLRKCPCPVWLYKPQESCALQKITAALDASPDDTAHAELNEKIIRLAKALAAPDHAHLDLVHAWSMYGERLVKDYMKPQDFEDLEQSLKEESWKNLAYIANQAGIHPPGDHLHLLRGDPTSEIPRFVAEQQTNLLVMGTVARQGVTGMMIGNTAEIILGQVDCSILAIKPDDFKSPIKARVRKEKKVAGTTSKAASADTSAAISSAGEDGSGTEERDTPVMPGMPPSPM